MTSVSARVKKVVATELCEIAPIVSLGQINNIGSDRLRKFKKDHPQEQRQINKHERTREKVAVLELREIAPIVSLGQINNIVSDRPRKFKKVCPQEQSQINERECTREKCWSLRIARNRTSSIIRPNK